MSTNDRSYLDHTITQASGMLLSALAEDTWVRWLGLALFVLGTVGRYYTLRAINARTPEAS